MGNQHNKPSNSSEDPEDHNNNNNNNYGFVLLKDVFPIERIEKLLIQALTELLNGKLDKCSETLIKIIRDADFAPIFKKIKTKYIVEDPISLLSNISRIIKYLQKKGKQLPTMPTGLLDSINRANKIADLYSKESRVYDVGDRVLLDALNYYLRVIKAYLEELEKEKELQTGGKHRGLMDEADLKTNGKQYGLLLIAGLIAWCELYQAETLNTKKSAESLTMSTSPKKSPVKTHRGAQELSSSVEEFIISVEVCCHAGIAARAAKAKAALSREFIFTEADVLAMTEDQWLAIPEVPIGLKNRLVEWVKHPTSF